MKRVSYLRQAVPLAPARERDGTTLLAPPRMLFRTSGASSEPLESVSTATSSVDHAGAKPPGRSVRRPAVRADSDETLPASPTNVAIFRPPDQSPDARATRAGAPAAALPSTSASSLSAAGAPIAVPAEPLSAQQSRGNGSPIAVPNESVSSQQSRGKRSPIAAGTENEPPTVAERSMTAFNPLESEPIIPALRLAPSPVWERGAADTGAASASKSPPQPTLAAPMPARSARPSGTANQRQATTESTPLTPLTPPRLGGPQRPERPRPAAGVHIGTLEVRVVSPAPQPVRAQAQVATASRPAARRAAVPARHSIARGFGVFGLGQS
jgi:hypothetical protein